MMVDSAENVITSQSRTELDSHANMVVVGKNCTIFDNTQQKCTVNSFSKETGTLEDVPIIDAVVAYDCPFKAKTRVQVPLEIKIT